MPELPEVETVVRGLAPHVNGRKVEWVYLSRGEIVHGRPAPLCAALRGRIMRRIYRRAKQVRFDLGDGAEMVIHLGMTGRLTIADAASPVEPHTHLRISFAGAPFELRFCDPRRFGGIWLLDEQGGDGHWTGRRLPPAGVEPLTLSLADLHRILNRRRQIKALLLDQQLICGLGNIYCDEILHRCGIHPTTQAGSLSNALVRRLAREIRRVLTAAIQAGGSSISDYRQADNTLGYFQFRHRVYGRAGESCKKCGAVIVRSVVAGRGTFVCPTCQPKRGKCERQKVKELKGHSEGQRRVKTGRTIKTAGKSLGAKSRARSLGNRWLAGKPRT